MSKYKKTVTIIVQVLILIMFFMGEQNNFVIHFEDLFESLLWVALNTGFILSRCRGGLRGRGSRNIIVIASLCLLAADGIVFLFGLISKTDISAIFLITTFLPGIASIAAADDEAKTDNI